MKNSMITGALALALASGAAFAGETEAVPGQATVHAIEGTVLVNTGERFVNIHQDTALAAGDRVLLMNEASAQLRFEDGCEVELQAESMVTIAESSPCAGPELQANRIGPMTAQAVGASGATTASAGPDTAAWVVFGTGAAAIGYLIVDGDLTITESTVPPPVSP